MSARFCVLASGSSGNCAFLQADGFGLLIDIGLGPRFIASRLATIGASWNDVHAVVLTHTHTDHWKELTIAQLSQRRIPLYCSPKHHVYLHRSGKRFNELKNAGLVRDLEPGESFDLPAGITCRTLQVPHDSDPTLGFRFDGPAGLFDRQWSLGYASDLGEVRPQLVEAFAGVSVLAIEFNHCEWMERASGRPKYLVDRVLGEYGHLSNSQAANAVREIVRASEPGTLRHLVQLHLSRDCNRAKLAAEAGRLALAEVGSNALVTTATQLNASHIIALDGEGRRVRPLAQEVA